MSIIGFSEGFHDAAICQVKNGNILHASHAERYSKIKNDRWLHKKQISAVGLKGLSNNQKITKGLKGNKLLKKIFVKNKILNYVIK